LGFYLGDGLSWAQAPVSKFRTNNSEVSVGFKRISGW
jgi:hypothetical protein